MLRERAGARDLSLHYNLASTPSIHVVPLLDEALWAVAEPGSGPDPARPLPWVDLCAHPVVLPLPGHGLRVLNDQARSSLDLRFNVAVETNSMTIQKMLVLAGLGWTVLPAAGVAHDVPSGVLSGLVRSGQWASARTVVTAGTHDDPAIWHQD